MVNLKKSLQSILSKKNYKFIILLLMGLVFIFLICGNYNLVEGLKLQDKVTQLNNAKSNIVKSSNLQNIITKNFSNEKNKKKDILKKELSGMTDAKNVIEGFLEGMHHCASNYSNLGLKGNQANLMVTSQCESLEHLKNKNDSVLNGNHQEELNYR